MPDPAPNKIPPPLIALLVQIAAWLMTLSCALLAHWLGYAVTLLPLALLCGVLAAHTPARPAQLRRTQGQLLG